MNTEILAFKAELDVVDALSIYHFASDKVLFADPSLGIPEFSREMAHQGCFDSCEFLYLMAGERTFFIYHHLGWLIICLLSKKDVNKTMLELGVKKLAVEISKN